MFDHKGKVKPERVPAMKEDALQAACVRWFRIQYTRQAILLFHIPNGGKRSGREAKMFQRMGVVAGVADLFLSIPGKSSHGLYIEMKRKGEKQRDSQLLFQQQVTAQGYDYVVCDSIETFINAVQNHLKNAPFYRPTWAQKRPALG
jgi:hypothetical protein